MGSSMPDYMTNARVMATLLTIPRMTDTKRSGLLIASLPKEAVKLGIALERREHENLNDEELNAYKVIIAQYS